MDDTHKVIAIIQARMGSTRLPGKVLMDIAGKPMLWHVVNRLNQSRLLNGIVVATSTNHNDDLIDNYCKENHIACFRGSENDVLERYYQAASAYNAENVARITSDCPLLDPRVVDLVIERHLKSQADYTSNTLTRTYPRGLDAEIFKYTVLSKACHEAKELSEREHVTLYFYRHPEIFRLESVEAQGKFLRPDIRICVDTQEDLQLIRNIFEEFSNSNKMFFLEEIIDLFNRKPHLLKINSMIQQKIV